MMKEILWISGLLTLPLMSYMLLNESRFKKNIVIGVTLPNQAREDEDVQKELKLFRRNIWIINGILVLLAVLGYLSVPKTLTLTSWIIWLLLSIALPYIPYVYTNSQLKKLKQQKGWIQQNEVIRVDTSAIGTQKYLSPLYFVAPVIISMLPLLFDRSMMFMYITMAILCVLFGFSYRYLYRNKAEMVDENTELTKALTQIRRYAWGKMWIVTSYAIAFYSLAGWLSLKNPVVGIIMTAVLTVILCLYALRLEMNLRKQQEKLTANSGTGWYVDDDEYWLGGVLYNNPNDNRLIINSRVGMNTSVNIAKPAGKLILALIAMLLLILPFTGVYGDYLSTQPIEIAVEDQNLKADLGIIHYNIDASTIKEIELLNTLPEGMQRIAGMGMDNLLQGSFSSKIGKMTVLADPQNAPFILIRTDEKTWLLGTRESSETERLYEQLMNQLQK